MPSKRGRLDRSLAKLLHISLRAVKTLLAQQRITVDGVTAQDVQLQVDEFSVITLDGKTVQQTQRQYWMVNKPAGVLSATKDAEHETIIDLMDDLIEPSLKAELHLVGRLDRASTGLVLLTNDSRWSQQLMAPDQKVKKHYRVRLKNELSEDYIAAFAQGMYFEFEDITTAPVTLTIISGYEAELILTEGKYHQIKRMFGRFRNPVMALHRFQIGGLVLDASLAEGSARQLNHEEMTALTAQP